MLLKSDTVHNAWAATQRTVGIKLTIKETEYDASDITSLTFDSGAMNGEALTLGSTYQNTIKVVFSRLIEGLALTDEITPELGIKLADGTWDYTPLGVFVIDAEVQQDRNNNTTTISASDRMCMMGGTYKSKLTYPAAINDIAVEVANLAAVKLNDDDFARLPTDKVANFGSVTYRDAIGYVAQFAGGFATFDRDGLLDIRQLADPNFEVTPSQYQSKGLTKNEALYRIGGIACTVTTTTADDSGNETQDTTTLQSGSTAGTQITISNPGMTQDLLDGLYEQLQDLNFYPFSLSWFGDPNLEAGDWIEVQDTAGNTFKTPNLLYSLTFSGGVTATSKADTTVSASANFVYKGQLHQIVDNIRQYLNAAGQQVSEGIDEPVHPKAGDVWFKKSGPDTYIMMYKNDPETGLGSWVEEVSTKGVSGLDEELKAAEAKLNADILAVQANLSTAQKDVAALQTKLAANDATQAQLSKDLSANSTILAQAQADIVANIEDLTALDAKLKANDDIQAQLQADLAANTKVQDQLKKDLSDNTKLIAANKESVDTAMATVNETLSKAQSDAASAVQKADDAVTNAQSAVAASGLATTTANSANDAATAAKNLATSTANSFATVQSQAATAANDAATALDQAKSALATANGVSDNYNSIKQIVDDTAGTIKTLATSEDLNAVSGRVTTAQSLAEQTANGLTLKADSSTVDTINNTVKQQAIDIKAAQDQLALKLTASDLTKGLSGYATQTWAQNQITATATGLEAKLSTVQSNLDNLIVGGRNLIVRTGELPNTMIHPDGSVGTYTGSALMANPIAVTAGENLILSRYGENAGSVGDNYFRFGFYDDNDAVILRQAKDDKSFVVRVPIGATKLKVSYPANTDVKAERGNKPTDWSPAPEDMATVEKLSELKLTVDGLTGTFATKNDLETTATQLKLTSDGLNLLTAVTGTNGEKVTQVIADVNNIKTTMTGANGVTTRLQTLEGFQQTATETLNGVATSSQVEQLTNLINLRVTKTDMQSAIDTSLLENGVYKDTRNDNQQPSWYWKNYPRQTVKEFKTASVLGLPGEEPYAAVDTVVRWNDRSGGPILQTARTNTNSYTRKSTSDTDWSPWVKTTDSSNVISQINISSEGVLIDGPKVHITAATTIDDASIQSAAIANLDAKKITSGSISADRLATTKLNADNITSGSISADRLATTKLNASNITSGSINAGLITTGVLSADMILGGTFDASKMTVKNIDAGSITSGSIATALLASTEINADNLTSGSIAAARIATTALSATNITSGTLDVGKLTVKNISADMIASGTIDASKITVKNLSASNIIGGELDAGLVNVKNLNASNIISGELNAGLVNVVGLNASAISAGTITGANLAINLGTGEVMFQKGSIKSADGHLNIDVNDGTFAQSDGTKGMLFAKGNLYLSSASWWDGLSNPDAAPKPDYGFIGYTDTVLTARGFGVIGRDALTLGLTDNGNPRMEYTASPVITMDRSNVTLDFAGELATIQAGQGFTIKTNPYYNSEQTPGIQIGSNVDRSGIGDRVFIDGSYVHIPSAYSRTASGSANLIVAADGAIVRTSSATKYKSNIERFRNTDMGEALLNLPQAHWYNKGDMQRYVDDPQHYSMPELDYGMIAEDLAAAGLEDLVVRGDDGQLEDIRYDRMTPALLPLLAQMKQEIEELKSAAKSA